MHTYGAENTHSSRAPYLTFSSWVRLFLFSVPCPLTSNFAIVVSFTHASIHGGDVYKMLATSQERSYFTSFQHHIRYVILRPIIFIVVNLLTANLTRFPTPFTHINPPAPKHSRWYVSSSSQDGMSTNLGHPEWPLIVIVCLCDRDVLILALFRSIQCVEMVCIT